MQQQAASRILNFELSDNNKAASLWRLFDIQNTFWLLLQFITLNMSALSMLPAFLHHRLQLAILTRCPASWDSSARPDLLESAASDISTAFQSCPSLCYTSFKLKTIRVFFLCIQLISKRNVHFNVIKLGHKLLHYFIAVPSRVIWLATTGNLE